MYLTGYDNEPPTDTLRLRTMTFYYSGKKPGIRPNALIRNVFFRKGELFSQDRQTFTQEAIARMGVFRYSEFRYEPKDTTANGDTLNVNMYATFDKPYNAELELNMTTKSTGLFVRRKSSFAICSSSAFSGATVRHDLPCWSSCNTQ